MKPNMNNHIGSAQGQAGAVMHFLLRLPWKLPRLCMCRPAGACCHCVWPGCRVCGWCISLIIRGLLRRENRRLVLQPSARRDGVKSARLWDETESQMDQTQNHTEKPSIVQTHICRTDCTCQSVVEERGKILNDKGHWHLGLGWQTWINIQILCKTVSSDTDLISSVSRW